MSLPSLALCWSSASPGRGCTMHSCSIPLEHRTCTQPLGCCLFTLSGEALSSQAVTYSASSGCSINITQRILCESYRKPRKGRDSVVLCAQSAMWGTKAVREGVVGRVLQLFLYRVVWCYVSTGTLGPDWFLHTPLCDATRNPWSFLFSRTLVSQLSLTSVRPTCRQFWSHCCRR